MIFYSILLLIITLLYVYRSNIFHILLSIFVPYILEYIIQNPKILPVAEKEVGEAEISGRLMKIPFKFNGQLYTYWTSYNRRANSETKFYSVKDGKEDEDLNWCPWIPLTITASELKVDKVDIRTPTL